MEEIKLRKPFKTSEGTMQSFVRMERQVSVGDWRYANKEASTMEDRTYFLIVKLCGLTPSEADQLCMADFNMLVDKLDMGDDPKAP